MVLRNLAPGLAVWPIPGAINEAALLQLKVHGHQQVQCPDGATSKYQLQDDAGDHACLSQTAQEGKIRSNQESCVNAIEPIL